MKEFNEIGWKDSVKAISDDLESRQMSRTFPPPKFGNYQYGFIGKVKKNPEENTGNLSTGGRSKIGNFQEVSEKLNKFRGG
jgi:hypothetical protein